MNINNHCYWHWWEYRVISTQVIGDKVKEPVFSSLSFCKFRFKSVFWLHRYWEQLHSRIRLCICSCLESELTSCVSASSSSWRHGRLSAQVNWSDEFDRTGRSSKPALGFVLLQECLWSCCSCSVRCRSGPSEAGREIIAARWPEWKERKKTQHQQLIPFKWTYE